MITSGPPLLAHVRTDEPAAHQLDDDELMRLVTDGSRWAFERLIRRHQARLRAHCARICGSGAGDEIAQEVFITVWKQRHAYEPRGRFRSYLFTIADRRSKNVKRSSVRSSQCAEHARECSEAETPLDELIATERQRRLTLSLAKLSPEQRDAILLHYTAGLDYEEIGQIAKRPASTIRARVFNGLTRLRKLIKLAGEV